MASRERARQIQTRDPVAEDDTRIHDILMQFHQDGKGLVTLLRGMQRLQPDATVSETGLEDGDGSIQGPCGWNLCADPRNN